MQEQLKTIREALKRLLDRDMRNTCQHDNTHRGGVLWEICDDCGMKWADDRGGKPEWKDPIEWAEAEAALTALTQLEAMVEKQEPVAWRDPSNCQPGQGCTYDKDVAAKWPHIYKQPLYAAPVAQQRKTVTNDEQASAYMDARLWEFIDMAGMWPRAKPDPRIWAHVMVYAPVAQQPKCVCGQPTSLGVVHRTDGPCFVYEAQQPQAEVAEVFHCKTCGCAMQMPHDDCLACERGETQQAEAVPPTHVLVPVAVLEAASESLGSFVSDHGWTDADMQAMDNLDAILAQQKGGV